MTSGRCSSSVLVPPLLQLHSALSTLYRSALGHDSFFTSLGDGADEAPSQSTAEGYETDVVMADVMADRRDHRGEE